MLVCKEHHTKNVKCLAILNRIREICFPKTDRLTNIFELQSNLNVNIQRNITFNIEEGCNYLETRKKLVNLSCVFLNDSIATAICDPILKLVHLIAIYRVIHGFCFFLKCLLLPQYYSYLYKIKSDWQLITDHFMGY